MRNKNLARFRVFPLTFTGFGALAGCLAGNPDPANDSVDSFGDNLRYCLPPEVVRDVPSNNPSFNDTLVNVGFGITRVARNKCAESCVKQQQCFVKDDWVETCLAFAPDCGGFLPYTAFIDYANASDADANTLYPENNEGPTWHYLGCGPQAAMNILNYYGVNLTIDQVYQQSNTIYIKSDAIAEFPDDLRDGLQSMLNAYGDGAFTVTRRSQVDDVLGLVQGELAEGRPSILLVHGGDHYYTVLGASGNFVYVIDYPTTSSPGPQPGKWVGFNDLGLSINPFVQAGAVLVAGVGGWLDNTVITIARNGPKPPPVPPPPSPCMVGQAGPGGCVNQLIKFSSSDSNVVGGGLGGQVTQGQYDSSFNNRKFDFLPVSGGWRIQQHGTGLCMSAGIAPDNKIFTVDCSTSCIQSGKDLCTWRFASGNNPYTGYTFLGNVNYGGGDTCLESDFGDSYTTTSSAPRLKGCSAPVPQNNFAKYAIYVDPAP